MPLSPGSTFERYRIDSLVGRGGMGEVYRALDTRLNRPVALKVLRSDEDAAAAVADAGGVARLLREAQSAAALSHANSVAIYELGEAEGIFYIAMEYVQGVTLRHYVGDASVSLETKVGWLVDTARALWAAHKAGLVHRDVKPGNVMVSEEGVVKVLDFGLAKAVQTSQDLSGFVTQMGQVLGTPRYMAPEQLEGHAADARSDQFAFGVTAYELLSGTFPGGPLAGSVPSLDSVIPAATEELAAVVARMMKRRSRDRFATMEEAAHALKRCAPALRAVHAGLGVSAASTDAATEARFTLPQPEPVSAAREIGATPEIREVQATTSTLPLAHPVKMAMAGMTAIGGSAMASPAPRTSPPNMNRTLPLARPQSIPVLFDPTPIPTSGIVRAKPSSSVSPPPLRSMPPPKASSVPMTAIAVFLAFAIAAGAIAAWLLR